MKWTTLSHQYPPATFPSDNPGRSDAVIVRDADEKRAIAYYYYPNEVWVYFYNNYGIGEIVEWTALSSDRGFYFEMLDHNLRMLSKDRETYSETTISFVDINYLEAKGYIQKSFDTGIQLIRLTNAGLNFISEGGFTALSEQQREIEYDKKLQRNNWITSSSTAKWSLFFSIIAVIIALLSFLFPDFNLLEWTRQRF